jgi:hypothetical protein
VASRASLGAPWWLPRRAGVAPVMLQTAAAAQTGTDAPAAGLTEIAAFTGGSLPGQVPCSPWDPGHYQVRRSQRRVAYPHQD